jgi:hypothetical protein
MDTLKTYIPATRWAERGMNNQKDTQKTDVNIYNQSDVPNDKVLGNMPALTQGESIYDFANKKTEKLVTALYLVSDCMDTDDALKGKLRLLGVELLSDVYKLSTLSPIERHNYLSVSLTHIYELLSFIEISYTIGFISEMNTMILKKEFTTLVFNLKNQQSKDKHFTFTLDEKMFELPEIKIPIEDNRNLDYRNSQSIKDMSLNNESKRTSFNNMSFIKNKSPFSNSQIKKTNFPSTNLTDRVDRTNKILSLIKAKMSVSSSENGISIKDISLSFTDCSEKTIQRELNSMVTKGQLKKTGAKRWSRYLIIKN